MKPTVENVEDYFGSLVCIIRMDKQTALRLAENLLQQVNEDNPNVGHNFYQCDGEADMFKVAVI